MFADVSSAAAHKRPTEKRVSIKIERLPELIQALRATEAEVRKRGLLPGDRT
jgi:hypothetical protein